MRNSLSNIILVIIWNLNLTHLSSGESCPSICNWVSWNAWSSCSSSCGGGRRSRSRGFCCKASLAHDSRACWRDCGMDYDSHRDEYWDYSGCNQVCYNGGIFERSGLYGSCRCTNTFYGSCCNNVCPYIENCKRRQCTSYWDTKCLECYDDKTFFKKTYGDTRCERMCAWNNHYCWPGICNGELTRGCSCAPGFEKIADSTKTLCQPSVKPSILTCDTVMVGQNGEKKRARSMGISTACSSLGDMYGNYQPILLQLNMAAVYKIDVSNYSNPNYIVESNFGITDLSIKIMRQPVNGVKKTLSEILLIKDSSQSTNVTQGAQYSMNISLSSATHALQNGEALCVEYVALGGGYLKSTNMITRQGFSAVPYKKTLTSRQMCYRYDNVPPEHCKASGKCSPEPLQLNYRITRTRTHSVSFIGWEDPIPSSGSPVHSSSIETYKISLHEVLPGNPSKLDTKPIFLKSVPNTVTAISFNITSNTPRLFSIQLEVKDVADNVRHARRFLLYNNTSAISIHPDNPFVVSSASRDTNFTWQTHHSNICLSWKAHFLNQFYFEHDLLSGVEAASGISGVYEQLTGEMSVFGTPNVDGIVGFRLSWKRDDGNFSQEIDIPNFLTQSYCQDLKVNDGQTYTFHLRPVDIAGNSLLEKRSVRIDGSAPYVKNMRLQKDEDITLFVNDSKDLARIQLHIEARDPHSGILKIGWKLRETDSGEEFATGLLATKKVSHKHCLQENVTCYCPAIGDCEISDYYIPLHELEAVQKVQGDQERNYTYEITVTNNAHLAKVEDFSFSVPAYSKETKPSVQASVMLGGVTGGLAFVFIAVILTACLLLRRRKGNSQMNKNKTINTNRSGLESEQNETNTQTGAKASSDTKQCIRQHIPRSILYLDNPSYEDVKVGQDTHCYEEIKIEGSSGNERVYVNLRPTIKPSERF